MAGKPWLYRFAAGVLRYFTLNEMIPLPQAKRLGGELASKFTAALLAAGATDPTAVPAVPPR
jgi:hypothetical protein